MLGMRSMIEGNAMTLEMKYTSTFMNNFSKWM